MSSDARITGRINIDPPITWGELHDQMWAIGQQTDHYPDAVVKLDTTEENTPDGVVRRHGGVAIVPSGHETNGYDLLDDVTRIVREFRTGPDGVVRSLDGYLHVVWAGGEDTYRVYVTPRGEVTEGRPEMRWPVGARDEDGVA